MPFSPIFFIVRSQDGTGAILAVGILGLEVPAFAGGFEVGQGHGHPAASLAVANTTAFDTGISSQVRPSNARPAALALDQRSGIDQGVAGGQVLGFVHRTAQLFGQQAAKTAVANGGAVGGNERQQFGFKILHGHTHFGLKSATATRSVM
jgi:hypothetical protein